MGWSATSAIKAYLDTLRLCNNNERRRSEAWIKRKEPGSNEFISALAAGMEAKLIVEVTCHVSPSTVALATAARHTGGRLVCILPEPVLAESKEVIKDTGLKDIVEFRTGDPSLLLPDYHNIDFSLVNCANDDYKRLQNLIDVNPTRSVVVANNLHGGNKGLGGQIISRGILKDKNEVVVRSTVHPIGKGMEVTMIGKSKKKDRGGPMKKSKWVFMVDEDSGEEHIYRVPT